MERRISQKSDSEIAKNYLSKEEISILERIVSTYLDIAELRALNQEPMYMKDWIETIDDYLKMARRDILTHKGTVSHKEAIEKAHREYEKYEQKRGLQLSNVEKHFLEIVNELIEIEKK